MGSSQSIQVAEDDKEDDEDPEEDGNGENDDRTELLGGDNLVKKVLEQEPEMLPCHASASPLSPQLSSFGTPRMGPSIKVWDPYNVLAPPPPLPPPPQFSRNFSAADVVEDDRTVTVFLISHGEYRMNLRPDLVAGRCPEAALTPNGKRQARALAVFLKSQGIRFSAVYTSPLDRAKGTALTVCQSAHTIKGKCIVHSFKDYTKIENVGTEDYFCRFEYKASTGGFTPDRVAVYCKCEMPYNPDDLMVQCEGCKDWFHPSCMGVTIEEAKKLEQWV